MSSPDGIIEGGEGHLSLVMLFVGLGLNSSRVLLQEDVRLVVGLSRGGSRRYGHGLGLRRVWGCS